MTVKTKVSNKLFYNILITYTKKAVPKINSEPLHISII